MIAVSDPPAEIRRNALDYFGGYNAFQDKTYSQIKEAAENLTLNDAVEIRRGLGINLVDLLETQKPLLHRTIEALSHSLKIESLYPYPNVQLTPAERDYWRNKIEEDQAWIPEESTEFYVLLCAIEESDKLARENPLCLDPEETDQNRIRSIMQRAQAGM